MGYINDQGWKGTMQIKNDINEVTLKDFLFKINNKIFVIKTFLHKIQKVDYNLCSYFKQEPETFFIYFFR